MISGINKTTFNYEPNFINHDVVSKRGESAANLEDKNTKNLGEEIEKNIRDMKNLPPNAPARIHGIFSLSGYTLKEEISVWGKISGLDDSFGNGEIKNLKNFLNNSKAFGFDKINRDLAEHDATNVDEFARKYINDDFAPLGIGYKSQDKGFDLLDSDISVDEFKDKWAEYAALKRLGESGAEKISVSGENITIITNKNKAPVEFKELESIEYEDEESKKFFIKFIRDSIEKGLDIVSVLEDYAEFKENDNNKPAAFKPIKAVSESLTYKDDISKEFFLNFLRVEQERGGDIERILQELAKINRLDIKV